MNALMIDTKTPSSSPKARKRIRRVDDRRLSRAIKLTYALSLQVNTAMTCDSTYPTKTLDEIGQDLEQIMAIYQGLGQ